MTSRRLLTSATGVAAAVALTAGCGTGTHYHQSSSGSHTASGLQGKPSSAVGQSTSQGSRGVIPSESPRPGAASSRVPTVHPNPAISTPTIPDPASATRTPFGVAKAWAIAANAGSYQDPSPGTWTERTQPFVTGAQAAAEQQQRTGGGGSTWPQIRAGKCVTSLRQLATTLPSDAPTGPDRHVVYLTALTTLSCASGQVQLSQFAAQLIVARIHGRWLVDDVHH